jgi:hypothetical protein
MTDIRVDVDPAAVREMWADHHGPVGQAVELVTQMTEGIATDQAPVSPIGSRYAPIGYLKEHTRTSAEHHYDDQGFVIGLVGAPVFPFAFISNFRSRKGYTVNPRSARHPGRMTVRRADDNYLDRAIELAPHIEIGDPGG